MFTVIRKYRKQLITNADKQGAKRELIYGKHQLSFIYGLDILVMALIITSLTPNLLRTSPLKARLLSYKQVV